MKRVLACLLVVACGDNLPERGDAHSGSRLKLAWYVYEGGARELETTWFYDAALQLRCVPTPWSDGHRYCTPAADEAVYVSDTCTRALGRTPITSSAAAYFATRFSIADELLPSRLFRRGEPTQTPAGIWRKGTDGCIGPFEPGDAFEYFELEDELAVTDLAAIRRSAPQGDGELSVILDTSSDGLRVPAAMFHRGSSSTCTMIDRPNADHVECVPASAPAAAYFHDAACTEPELGTADAPVPTHASHFIVETSCWEYYTVGDEVTAPPLYERTGAGCLAVSPPEGQRFFTVAGTQPMPQLARLHEVSVHRVQSITRINEELRLRDTAMYDALLATDCAHDSELRCAPRTNILVQPFFADAQCNTPIELALVPSGACDPPSRFATDGVELYPLAAPYPSTIYVPYTGDTCGVFRPLAPFVAYAIGPALDRSQLARAELMIDP